MTLVLDQLRQWQGEGGPAEWQASWERALELLGPVWPTTTLSWDGVVHADGGAALATAFYILACENGIPPSRVTRDQVGSLIAREHGETDASIAPRWEARLRALGHDLEDAANPVAVTWRRLRRDNSPSDDMPERMWEAVHIEDSSAYRWGPAYLEGLRRVLAPLYADQLQF
jgi:hypothetical protein